MSQTEPNMNKRGLFLITTILLTLLLFSLLFMGMKSPAETMTVGLSDTVSEEEITIDIQKPLTWQSSETKVVIAVSPLDAVKKVEARVGDKGSWVDITDELYTEISENMTVYIQVTDKNGKVHTKSRYLEIFDRTPPTLKARISKTTLQIDVEDSLSGVYAVYIDGEKYSDFVNGTLNLRVEDVTTSKYDKILLYATDHVGNRSATIELTNPLFVDESKDNSLNKQATTTSSTTSGSASTSSNSSGNASTSSTSSGNASTTSSTSGNAQATQNTTSATSGANTSSSTSSGNPSSSSGGGSGNGENPLFGTFEDTNKQFMTIVTKDGKIFYMIIDHDKDSENVYFLTEVTNSDLQSFTSEESTEGTNDEFFDEQTTESSTEENTNSTLNDNYTSNTTSEKTESSPSVSSNTSDENFGNYETKEEEEPQKSSSFFFVILIALIVIGGGYYVKIYKPKKELENADNLDDYNFIEEGEPTSTFSIEDELDTFTEGEKENNLSSTSDEPIYEEEEEEENPYPYDMDYSMDYSEDTDLEE